MRQPASDDRVVEPLASCDTQPTVVEESTLAALGGKKLVADRVVNKARDDIALAFEGDRNGELRNAVEEIRCAVERIDDPSVRFVRSFDASAFLAEEAI